MASRMIITVSEAQRRALKREARQLGISVSELVRRCLDAQLGAPGGFSSTKEALLSMMNLGRGDGAAVATRHHDALRDILRRPRGRVR